MLYSEIIVVSLILTQKLSILCEQNIEMLNDNLAVHIVTTGFRW